MPSIFNPLPDSTNLPVDDKVRRFDRGPCLMRNQVTFLNDLYYDDRNRNILLSTPDEKLSNKKISDLFVCGNLKR